MQANWLFPSEMPYTGGSAIFPWPLKDVRGLLRIFVQNSLKLLLANLLPFFNQYELSHTNYHKMMLPLKKIPTYLLYCMIPSFIFEAHIRLLYCKNYFKRTLQLW